MYLMVAVDRATYDDALAVEFAVSGRALNASNPLAQDLHSWTRSEMLQYHEGWILDVLWSWVVVTNATVVRYFPLITRSKPRARDSGTTPGRRRQSETHLSTSQVLWLHHHAYNVDDVELPTADLESPVALQNESAASTCAWDLMLASLGPSCMHNVSQQSGTVARQALRSCPPPDRFGRVLVGLKMTIFIAGSSIDEDCS
ncbi:hypothetical protein Micbo1qcDRAFT_220979 [Microdochium bolleyi]|uniref:Uncharacterized protein n=1 Tax=Microdochium bolleyi TaxID=196109 RepID=A0A136JB93_9PEZI|nr:hypothetical protein Micbo1qcDRAFT_220979 [Microdochium bolleyi]